MGAVILMMVAGILETPTLVWMDAVDTADHVINVPAQGTYTVWAWMKDGQQASVSLGGAKFHLSPGGNHEGRYRWAKAGELALDPGPRSIFLSETIAAVVIAADPEFDPSEAIGHMRVYDQPQAVSDARVAVVRDTDTVFTMPQYTTRRAWEALATNLRRRILVSSGLWPLPDRTPLNAAVFDPVTHEDYIVEKVHFEAYPGFLATGNLYRPVGNGPFPAVACPHGHWKKGRLENSEVSSVPGRCITFARMGIVAFSYDMVGYNDSIQFEHRWESPREKLWGLHPFALQLWTSIRALDFLESLPYVDGDRLSCSGASGGGTQTFALAAVDPRVKVAAPVNMISCSMQGGCVCENAPLIRLENSNMEIGALMAPRPLLLVSATGDWTVDTPRVEYPGIRSIYRLYGAEDRVESVQIDADHNYNRDSREQVYRFFGKWLLGQDEKWEGFTEPAFTVELFEALRVFPDEQLPQGYPDAERIKEQIIDQTRAKWEGILPNTLEEHARFHEEYGAALSDVLGASVPQANQLRPERVSVDRNDRYIVERWVLHDPGTGAAVPALLYRSNTGDRQDAVLIVHGKGKAALADPEQARPGDLLAKLLGSGKAVMTIGAFLTGEHHAPQARTVRHVGKYPDTFLPSDTAYRVHDILTALAYLRSRRDLSGTIDLVGLEDGGIWCLFASALDSAIRNTVVDANQFDNVNDEAWVEKYYVPCIRNIGDVTTAAMLIAPRPLTVVNTGEAFDTTGIRKAWAVAGADTLTITQGASDAAAVAAMLMP